MGICGSSRWQINLWCDGHGSLGCSRRFGAGRRIRFRASAALERAALRVGRERKPHEQIRELRRRRLRIDQLQTAFDRRALVLRCVVNTLYPRVRPARGLNRRLALRIGKQCIRRAAGRNIDKDRSQRPWPKARCPQSSARYRHSGCRASSRAVLDRRHRHHRYDRLVQSEEARSERYSNDGLIR